jgi:hypothetical protein
MFINQKTCIPFLALYQKLTIASIASSSKLKTQDLIHAFIPLVFFDFAINIYFTWNALYSLLRLSFAVKDILVVIFCLQLNIATLSQMSYIPQNNQHGRASSSDKIYARVLNKYRAFDITAHLHDSTMRFACVCLCFSEWNMSEQVRYIRTVKDKHELAKYQICEFQSFLCLSLLSRVFLLSFSAFDYT